MDKYIKWVATIVLVVGQFVTAMGYYPVGPMILIGGGLLWLIVSIMWREPALIATNGIMTAAGVIGLSLA